MAKKFYVYVKDEWRKFIFPLLTGFMILVAVAFVVYSSFFLATHLKRALETNAGASESALLKFDIEGFEKLHLLGK